MKTTRINLPQLHNEEHFQFHTEFKTLVIQVGAPTLNVEVAFNNYVVHYKEENDAIQLVHKSATTEQLIDADAERDDIFRGFVDAVKSSNNHFNGEKRLAASRVMVLLGQYGNVARKSYNEETAAINKLVQEAQGSYLSDITVLGLGDWITELNSKNLAFDTLMKNRYSEEASKTELRMKQVRDQVDNAFHEIVNRIDALIVVNGLSTFEAFVREFNTRVDKYNNILAHRKGHNAKVSATAKTEISDASK